MKGINETLLAKVNVSITLLHLSPSKKNRIENNVLFTNGFHEELRNQKIPYYFIFTLSNQEPNYQ